MTDTDQQPPAGPAEREPEPQPSEAGAPQSAEELRASLEQAEARAAELHATLLRTAAELENVRKRGAREIEAVRQYGVERFAATLLPVLDSLSLGLAAAGSADAETLASGQQATLRLLMKALAEAGITELDPAGEPFDPQLHEAMVTQPTADQAPDTVLQVAQKGYLLNGRLLRPARVIVARAPDEAPAA